MSAACCCQLSSGSIVPSAALMPPAASEVCASSCGVCRRRGRRRPLSELDGRPKSGTAGADHQDRSGNDAFVVHGAFFLARTGPFGWRGDYRETMQKTSLTALMRHELEHARTAPAGRSSKTVYGGREKVLRQTVIALRAGEAWMST